MQVSNLRASPLVTQLIEPAAPLRHHPVRHHGRSVIQPVLDRLGQRRNLIVQHRFEGRLRRSCVVIPLHQIAEQLPERLRIPSVNCLGDHERARQRFLRDVEANRSHHLQGGSRIRVDNRHPADGAGLPHRPGLPDQYGVSNSSDSWQSRMQVCIQSSQFDPDCGPPPTVLSDEKATSTLLKMFFSVSRNADASGSSL